MQKSSMLFLAILAGLALLGAYQAFVPAPFPATAAIRFLGLGAFFLLCVSLIIGPLAVLRPSQFASLVEPRRAIGLAAFAFLLLHYLLVASLYFKFDFSKIIALPPLAIALPALALFFIVALTSFDWAVSKLGMNRWKAIQRLTYIAFVLVFAHFILKANGLLSQDGKPLQPNLAEIALVFLGAATILLQVFAFFEYRKRKQK